MQIRSLSDLTYATIAWLPVLVFTAAFAMWIMSGMIHLEARSWGTSWFIDNDRTVSEWQLYAAHRDAQAEQQAVAYDI